MSRILSKVKNKTKNNKVLSSLNLNAEKHGFQYVDIFTPKGTL